MQSRLASLFLIALASCSSAAERPSPVAQAGSDSWIDSRGYSPPQPDMTGLDRDVLTVAPEAALVVVDAQVEAADRATALRRVREVSHTVAAASNAHCRISPWTFDAIEQQGDSFVAHAQLRLRADLEQLETAEARHERLEECLGQVHALDPSSFADTELRLSAPLITVGNLARYRDELLERHFAGLRAVATSQEVPAQFHAADLRCTSSGEVSIVSRSLAGVGLAVDFQCRPEDRSAVAPPSGSDA